MINIQYFHISPPMTGKFSIQLKVESEILGVRNATDCDGFNFILLSENDETEFEERTFLGVRIAQKIEYDDYINFDYIGSYITKANTEVFIFEVFPENN